MGEKSIAEDDPFVPKGSDSFNRQTQLSVWQSTPRRFFRESFSAVNRLGAVSIVTKWPRTAATFHVAGVREGATEARRPERDWVTDGNGNAEPQGWDGTNPPVGTSPIDARPCPADVRPDAVPNADAGSNSQDRPERRASVSIFRCRGIQTGVPGSVQIALALHSH